METTINAEQAKWFAIGRKTRQAVKRLQPKSRIYGDKLNTFENWDLFKESFGFFQFKNRNKPTEEQLGFLERGFRSIDTKETISKISKPNKAQP